MASSQLRIDTSKNGIVLTTKKSGANRLLSEGGHLDLDMR